VSRSTSNPSAKWYHRYPYVFGYYPGWFDDDIATACAEREQDEQERLRAADMMAVRFVHEHWIPVQALIDDARSSLAARINLNAMRAERRVSSERVTGINNMLQEF
jgi:hypothetical protein